MKFTLMVLALLLLACNRRDLKHSAIVENIDTFKQEKRKVYAGVLDSICSSNVSIDQLMESGSNDSINGNIDRLKAMIDILCDSALQFIQPNNVDSNSIYGLKKAFTIQKSGYQNNLEDESELVFMSFGKPSTAKEARQEAATGYRYLFLERKYSFLRTVYDNIKNNSIKY